MRIFRGKDSIGHYSGYGWRDTNVVDKDHELPIGNISKPSFGVVILVVLINATMAGVALALVFIN